MSSCGYTSLYSQKNDLNFTILNLELDGNFLINNYLKQKLEIYQEIDSEKEFELEIKTTLNKFSVGKDSKGNTTNLRLVANLDLDINKINNEGEQIKQTTSFSESITIKKSEINYEQSIYEEILIKNMSELLFKKLVFYLSRN